MTYRRLFDNTVLYGIDDVAHVVVGDVRAGGEADAYFEESFRHAVDVGGSVFINGLTVHGLPQGTG